jgi:ethanolamine utilization cobalamin adenosyltransferase
MGLKKVEKKARKLFREKRVRLDFESEKRIYFTVYSREVHSVIFDKGKNEFKCDCKYFSVKQKECSHIKACKLLLKDLERRKQ